jgi:hypothetical protein
MKPDIHPKLNPVVFVDGKHEIVTLSTLTSSEQGASSASRRATTRSNLTQMTAAFEMVTLGRRVHRNGSRPADQRSAAALCAQGWPMTLAADVWIAIARSTGGEGDR